MNVFACRIMNGFVRQVSRVKYMTTLTKQLTKCWSYTVPVICQQGYTITELGPGT